MEVPRLDDREHPLLALRGEHLDRVHAGLALGDARDVDVHAGARLRGRLRRRTRQPCRAQVLHADGEARVEHLEAGLDEPLLLERVADLDRRSLGLRSLVEAGGREDARAADAVAPRRRAEQHREVARSVGAREHEPLLGEHAEAQHVHQRVLAVAVVEHDLAADGRDPDRVPVAADARHDAFEEVARAARRRGSRSAAGP